MAWELRQDRPIYLQPVSYTHLDVYKRQPTWWDDMDLVLAEAQKRGMKVWILDDKHFPTGYANGLIPKKYPHLRRWHLIENHIDVIGPARENAILMADTTQAGDDDDILLGVYRCV